MVWTGYIGLEYVPGTGSCGHGNEHPSLYKNREVSGLAINGTFSSMKLVVLNKSSSSSSLARQPLVDPGLLKKLCPFVSIEGDYLPILDP